MDTFDFKIQGIDALQNKLKAVSDEVRYKGGRAGLRKGANFVRDVARQNAERFDDTETGRSISKNIMVRWSARRFKRTGDLMFRVGVAQGAKIKQKGNPDTGVGGSTPHWRLKEFGTENMPADPFMRPALADNIDRVTSIVAVETEKAIDRALKRAGK